MRLHLFFLFLLAGCTTSAQKQTFNLASYMPPTGWKKLVKEQAVQYSKQDDKKGTYCVITLYKSIDATGTPKDNFDNSWNALVNETLGVEAVATMQAPEKNNDWEAQTGSAGFESEGNQAVAVLITSTGFNKAINILVITNSREYEPQIAKFLESVDLKKPAGAMGSTVNQPKQNSNPTTTTQTVATGKFKFNTTNFGDGWTSTVKEDWVEVVKGDIKVLLHYPNPNLKPANTDVDVMCEAAWNLLVSSRYSDIKNYKVGPSVLDYERPYYAQAGLTESSSGRQVFVALLKKGNTCWMEFVAPDKNTFIQTFGLDITTVNYYSNTDIWDKMIKMNGYNKFAVAASDIAGTGKWSDFFASNTYYANAYTGASAGMSTYSSSQFFNFSAGQKYNWQIIGANSYGGTTKIAQAKSAGSFKMLNDWQIYFTDIEKKPKTYDVYFSCIKGKRVLWMNDANYPGSGIFTGYSKE